MPVKNPRPAAPSPLPTAPLRKRMAAWLYEGMLLFGIVFGTSLVLSIALDVRHGMAHRTAQQAAIFLACGAYFTWSWHKGQTLAMRSWDIKVVRTDGLPLSLTQAALRYVLAWIWLLPPLVASQGLHTDATQTAGVMLAWATVWALLSRAHPDRQFWHDAWAGSRLVVFERPKVGRLGKKD